MSNFKIKETYLLFLIVIGLISLAGYSTYALFTASAEIEDVVEFSTSLSTNNSIVEYEMVTVPSGETKIIELNITNSYTSTLYYGAWYEMVSPGAINDDIEIGLYTDKNNTPGSGSIASGTTLSLLVGITNNTSSDVIINIGTAGSLTNSLGLASSRTLIPSGFTEAIIVTDEVLAEYSTIVENPVNLTYSYTGNAQEVTLNPGTYKLEVWGAQGGSYSSTYYGGYGGYSYGTLTLTEETDAYVYVGGQGTGGTTTGTKVGGFNGGGSGYSTSTYYVGAGGGGASDIRLGQDSLYARVIVAGGGGGAGSYSSTSTRKYVGGAGGGTSGGTGNQYSTSYRAGTGGSATAAGTSYYGTTSNSTSYGTIASFGAGGGSTSTNGIAGGGGGWYGGGYGRRSSGGGGSGYVYTSSTASNCPSGCLLNSSYYLTDAATNTYSQTGNGAAKITGTERITKYTIPRLIGLDSVTIMLGTSIDLYEGVSAECAVGETGCSLGETSVSDTSTLSVGTNIIYYTVKDSKNKKYKYARQIIVKDKFEYTIPARSELLLGPGSYKLEVWGAQGGVYEHLSKTYVGGKGGYSYGTLNLAENIKTYIYVGGRGVNFSGGFNGGGNGNSGYPDFVADAAWMDAVAGGGGSDIRIGGDSLYARVIVAGGGAGYHCGTSSCYSGQYGGGSSGGGTYYGGSSTVGGTQISAGPGGTFGIGSNASVVNEAWGGGGGGWYGGGSTFTSYNNSSVVGGGSGWVYTASTFNTWQSGNPTDAANWLLNSSYYLTDAATIAGNQSFSDFNGSTVTGHSGDGAVRITKIG